MADYERLKEIEIAREAREKITVPTEEIAPLEVSIWNLQQQKAKSSEEDQFVELYETVDCSVWDGAIALSKAIEQKFKVNFVQATIKDTIFGQITIPVAYHSVEISFDETTQVPWGKISIPYLEGGYIHPSTTKKNGRLIFQFMAYARKRHEKIIKELGDMVRELAKKESIYRGKAFKTRFLEDDGKEKPMPEFKFLDLSAVRVGEMIFNPETQFAIEINLFNPIMFSKRCRDLNIPLKRGILLAGTFGTGKTLTAYQTARKAMMNNWTFIYCRSVDELTHAIHFATQYSPAVVFCEDIDSAVSGKRDNRMNDLFNTIDGVDTKSAEIIMVLTTNNLQDMHQGMIRPGRIDSLIKMTPPEGKTVEKLIRLYARNLLEENADLSEVSKELSGEIPAIIAECVEKAKLAAMSVDNAGMILTPEALLKSAISMRSQREILRADPREDLTTAEKAAKLNGDALGKSLGTSLGNALTALISLSGGSGNTQLTNWSNNTSGSATTHSAASKQSEVDQSSLQLVNGYKEPNNGG